MDQISIHGLAVETIIGIHDWERRQKQLVRIDLTVHCNTHNAARTDAIEDTVSYGDVARLVSDLAERSDYSLIEALAGAIAETLLAGFDIQSVTVVVHKPGAVANADSVSVSIHRSRE